MYLRWQHSPFSLPPTAALLGERRLSSQLQLLNSSTLPGDESFLVAFSCCQRYADSTTTGGVHPRRQSFAVPSTGFLVTLQSQVVEPLGVSPGPPNGEDRVKISEGCYHSAFG